MIVSDWKKVVSVSFSLWMDVIGLVILVVPQLLYAVTGIDTDPQLLLCIGVLLIFAGIIGRLLEQTSSIIREWKKIIGVLVVVLVVSYFGSPLL